MLSLWIQSIAAVEAAHVLCKDFSRIQLYVMNISIRKLRGYSLCRCGFFSMFMLLVGLREEEKKKTFSLEQEINVLIGSGWMFCSFPLPLLLIF